MWLEKYTIETYLWSDKMKCYRTTNISLIMYLLVLHNCFEMALVSWSYWWVFINLMNMCHPSTGERRAQLVSIAWPANPFKCAQS